MSNNKGPIYREMSGKFAQILKEIEATERSADIKLAEQREISRIGSDDVAWKVVGSYDTKAKGSFDERENLMQRLEQLEQLEQREISRIGSDDVAWKVTVGYDTKAKGSFDERENVMQRPERLERRNK